MFSFDGPLAYQVDEDERMQIAAATGICGLYFSSKHSVCEKCDVQAPRLLDVLM